MATDSDVVGEPILFALLQGDAARARQLIAAAADQGSVDSTRRSRLVAHRAFAAILESNFSTAHAECVTAARHDADDLLIGALRTLASAMGGCGHDEQDFSSVEQVVARVTTLTDEEVVRVAWAVCMTAEAAMSIGRLDLAELASRRAWDIAAARSRPESVFAGMTLVRALLFQGQLGEAAEIGGCVGALAGAYGLLALQLVVSGTLAYVAALSDDVDTMRRRINDIERLAPRCSSSYLVNGAMVLASYALAVVGHARPAYDMFLQAAGGTELSRVQLVDRAYGCELLVTAALSLGDNDSAKRWGDVSAALTGTPIDGMASAAIRRTAARLAVAEGDPVTSAELAGEASSIAVRNAGHLDAARAQLLAGSALIHRPQDEAQALEVLTHVGNEATLFGATTLSLLARRDLRSIGMRPVGAKQAPMSPRERQVAEMLVAGRSNTAIARALSISERTVQSHVRRVLEALELPSRASVPRALGQRGSYVATTQLTTRQREVADLVARGYTNSGVARVLGVSVKTVEKHLGDIYRRLQLNSRAGLAAQWPRPAAVSAVTETAGRS